MRDRNCVERQRSGTTALSLSLCGRLILTGDKQKKARSRFTSDNHSRQLLGRLLDHPLETTNNTLICDALFLFFWVN